MLSGLARLATTTSSQARIAPPRTLISAASHRPFSSSAAMSKLSLPSLPEVPKRNNEASAAFEGSIGKINAVPAPQPSKLNQFPGFAPESAKIAEHLLTFNHKEYHIFFNDKGFHNHLSHHLLAAMALGAPPSSLPNTLAGAIQEGLDLDFHLNIKPPVGKGPTTPITEANWHEHLSQREAYWNYLAFFDAYIAQNGAAKALERFIFADDVQEKGIDMIARFTGGAIHPYIHAGYGLEFGLDALVAEGLSMACITENNMAMAFPPGWRANVDAQQAPSEPLNLFSLTTLVSLDDKLAPNAPGGVQHDGADKMVQVPAETLLSYAAQYHVPAAAVEDGVDAEGRPKWWRLYEELVWFNVALLGATTRPGHTLRHDFFLMHSHNATLFLPSILPALSPKSRATLLHAHLRTGLFWWIRCGRPAFFVDEVMMKPVDVPGLPGFAGEAKGSIDKEGESVGWASVLAAAAVHDDEHVVKAIRALAHFASHFGSTPAGTHTLQAEAKKALEAKGGKEKGCWRGLEALDGTAFENTARQIFVSQGVRGDGKKSNLWNYAPPGFDQNWE